jgi:hypothetical protein
MLKNRLILILAFLMPAAACDAFPSRDPAEAQVRDIAEGFGAQLKTVSLQSPFAVEEIRENYSPYAAPGLLERWENDPSTAPGRLVSSPWPERIEITSLEKRPDGGYLVEGEIIEITSVELLEGGAANKIPVTMTIEKIQGSWLITAYQQGGTPP